MPIIAFYGLLVISVFMYWPIQAQNIIYTVQEEAIPAKVTEISDAIIKYKAPESPGDLFDGTEIDEMEDEWT